MPLNPFPACSHSRSEAVCSLTHTTVFPFSPYPRLHALLTWSSWDRKNTAPLFPGVLRSRRAAAPHKDWRYCPASMEKISRSFLGV